MTKERACSSLTTNNYHLKEQTLCRISGRGFLLLKRITLYAKSFGKGACLELFAGLPVGSQRLPVMMKQAMAPGAWLVYCGPHSHIMLLKEFAFFAAGKRGICYCFSFHIATAFQKNSLCLAFSILLYRYYRYMSISESPIFYNRPEVILCSFQEFGI